MKRFFPLLLLMALSLSLAACSLIAGGSNGSETEAQQVETRVTLVCSQECRQFGQCGVNDNDEAMVLGHSASPSLTGHDRLFPADQAVILLQRQAREAGTQARAQIPVTFFNVRTEDGSQVGWVAGWCVSE
jgi:hypothetical protein